MTQPIRKRLLAASFALMTATLTWSIVIWCGELKLSYQSERPRNPNLRAKSPVARQPLPVRNSALNGEFWGRESNEAIAEVETSGHVHDAAASYFKEARRWIPQIAACVREFWSKQPPQETRHDRSIASANANAPDIDSRNRTDSTVEPILSDADKPSANSSAALDQQARPATDSASQPVGSNVPAAVAEAESLPPATTVPSANVLDIPTATWPIPDSLLRHLDDLQPVLESRAWWSELRQSIGELAGVSELDDSRVAAILDRLTNVVDQMGNESRLFAADESNLESRDVAARISRTGYDLHRIVQSWQQVHQLATSLQPVDTSNKLHARDVSFHRPISPPIDPKWRDYLVLDSFEAVGSDRQQAARTVLSRINSVALNADQFAQVRAEVGPELEQQLRRAAASPIDLRQFLNDLKQYHDHANGFSESRLNDCFQNLLWNGQPQYLALAQTIDNHYRNANVRFAISESILNRLVDRPFTSDEPVRDRILGADVSGRSEITNRLDVRLVPDERQWSLVLNTTGNIHSRTQARRDGFTIHSVGSADVTGSKRLSVSYNGVASELPLVEAVTANHVIGLDSPYDDIPLLGWTARRVARRKQQAFAPQAEQIVRSRIRSRVQERIEQAVTAALQKAKDALDRMIVTRFVDWSLEPQPIEMSTSENELILRYRLAGFDQMGADTPRPEIDGPRAISLQIHESAINNGLIRLGLAGESFTIDSLIDHLESKLQTRIQRTGDTLHEAQIEFAPYDPIRIDFEEGGVAVAMHLKRLQVDGGKTWRNITVQTRYDVRFDGFYLTLAQSGGVRAEGSRIRVREEMAIGAIFDQLLRDEYQFSLLPQAYEADFAEFGIQLEHIELADGWLSIAYRDSREAPSSDRQASLIPHLQ